MTRARWSAGARAGPFSASRSGGVDAGNPRADGRHAGRSRRELVLLRARRRRRAVVTRRSISGARANLVNSALDRWRSTGFRPATPLAAARLTESRPLPAEDAAGLLKRDLFGVRVGLLVHASPFGSRVARTRSGPGNRRGLHSTSPILPASVTAPPAGALHFTPSDLDPDVARGDRTGRPEPPCPHRVPGRRRPRWVDPAASLHLRSSFLGPRSPTTAGWPARWGSAALEGGAAPDTRAPSRSPAAGPRSSPSLKGTRAVPVAGIAAGVPELRALAPPPPAAIRPAPDAARFPAPEGARPFRVPPDHRPHAARHGPSRAPPPSPAAVPPEAAGALVVRLAGRPRGGYVPHESRSSSPDGGRCTRPGFRHPLRGARALKIVGPFAGWRPCRAPQGLE